MTVKVEIQTAPGVWLDITSDVYQRDAIQITRGRSDEQSQAGPQRMTFTLDNRDGKYSPRNPLSPLYGKIGRNTPVRCTLDGVYGRFYGEVSSWPPRWDPSHSDNYVPVEAYGILRRLGQGQPPASNALRDWILQQDSLAAYYPLGGGEDTIYSQNLAPGKTGSLRGTTGAVFKYGVDMGASWLGTGMELSAAASPAHMEATGGAVGSYVALDFVFRSDNLGVLDVKVWPTYDSYWNLKLNTSTDDGTLQVSYYDDANGLWTDGAFGPIPELQDAELHTCRFLLYDNGGGSITYIVTIDGASDFTNGTVTPPLTGVPMVWFYYTHYTNQTVVNLAHVALWAGNDFADLPSVTDFYDAAIAYAGEDAVNRIIRVASDGGFLIGTASSDPNEAAIMGPQFTETRLAQIRDAETADMGLLYEDTAAAALMYKSRSSLYNLTPAFTLDYGAGHVSPPLEPVDDDQQTRNDVTATRRDGGSARYTVDTGPMSTQDPPDGVGRYDTEVTVNVETDGMLDGIAAWVANLGSLDKARWPSVTVNLANPRISTTLRNQIKAAEIGDWFVITNMDAAFVYDDVYLIIVGYSETIEQFQHIITFVCMPADPYQVAVYDTSRYDAIGSTLLADVSATATSIQADTGTRTNLVTNPSFGTNTTGWATTGSGVVTLTRVTTEAVVGIASGKVITDGAGANQGVFLSPQPSASASTAYTASVYLKGNAGGEQITLQIRSIAGGVLLNAQDVTLDTSWTRYTVTGTTPAGATGVYMLIRTTGTSAATWFVDGAMIEQGSGGDYFDGDTAEDGTYFYSWTGTADASTSTASKLQSTLWTTDPTMFPFDIRMGGERITVTNITGSSSPQTFGPLIRSVNGVVKAQTAGTEITLWDTPRYAL